MAFVRTKRVGDYEYRQLVENYRENGHHRQRVLAHLGHYGTVEEAIEGARQRLANLEASRLAEQVQEAEREVAGRDRSIRERYGEQLARYHDGEIPTLAEFAQRTGTERRAAWDEVVPIPPEVDEYCRAFGDGTVLERRTPDFYGHTAYYPGLYEYESWLRPLWSWRRQAVGTRRQYERRGQYHRDRIAKLERVARSLRGD